VDPHRLAEETSIALHEAVARELRRRPSLVEGARARVTEWRGAGTVHSWYVERWSSLLEGPFEVLLATLVDEGEEARALRQVSPFAGVRDPRTRWAIWRNVRSRQSVEAP
jgi:hypothetical protein